MIAIPEIFKIALPVLLSVTVCGALLVFISWLPNDRLKGESPSAAAVPFPESEMLCGLPGASSATVTDADLLPAEEGVNVTVTVQLALTARVASQFWVFEN